MHKQISKLIYIPSEKLSDYRCLLTKILLQRSWDSFFARSYARSIFRSRTRRIVIILVYLIRQVNGNNYIRVNLLLSAIFWCAWDRSKAIRTELNERKHLRIQSSHPVSIYFIAGFLSRFWLLLQISYYNNWWQQRNSN